MSMRCITVPPRMNPSGFSSFGRTTSTISVADSAARFGVTSICCLVARQEGRKAEGQEFKEGRRDGGNDEGARAPRSEGEGRKAERERQTSFNLAPWPFAVPTFVIPIHSVFRL